MDQDTSKKDPQDTSQAGGATPPAQDQPQQPAQPAEPKAEPAEKKPEEAPAEAPAEPAAEAPVKPEEKPAEPTSEAKPEAEKPTEPTPAPTPPEAPEEPPVEKPAEAPTPPAPEEKAEAPTEAPAEEKPAEPAVAPTPTPAEAAPTEAPKAEATKEECECPEINEAEWDKQKKTLDKAFYKTWSPRLFYYPFSFAIDLSRAKTGAKTANYTIPENPMVLDTGGMFWSSVMVEITGEKPEDKNVVSLKGKEVYTKVSKRPWNEIKTDIEELKKELGKEPSELYLWYTSCPKCMDKKEVKTVLIAVP